MEETNCFPALPLSAALTHVNAENLTGTAAIVQHGGLEESNRKKCTMQHLKGPYELHRQSYVELLSSLVQSSNYFINIGIKNQNFYYTLTFFQPIQQSHSNLNYLFWL